MDLPPADIAAQVGAAPRGAAAPRRLTARRRPVSVVRQTSALFLAFLGFYLITASGHFYTVDEETLYLMTESLVERGSLALSANDWGIVGDWGLTIAPGSTTEPVYAIFSPGQPIAAVPFYLVGKGVAAFFPASAAGFVTRFFVSLFGAFVTAATVALLYRLARHLDYRGGAALGLAATYGLATTAWPHGRTFLAEPLTALCLLTALYGIRRGTEARPYRIWLVCSGAAAVGAVVTKPHALIAVALFCPYLLWCAAAPGHEAGRWRFDARRALRACAIWGGGAAAVAWAYLLFNLAIYGVPLRSGYGDWPLALFNYPLLKGLYGLVLSSGKGIVWYAPPVVLAVAALRPFWRRHPAEATLCIAIVVAHLLFYSRLRFWHGDWIWGPRFLLIALPFAILPLVAWLEGLRARRWRFAAVALVVTAGIGVQLLGTSVNFAWYIARETDQEARWFAPAASPILAHARQARARVALWAGQFAHQPDTVVLTSGFAVSDQGDDAIFPRWTTGSGTIALRPANRAPLTAKLTFFDHRPTELRAVPPSILLSYGPLNEHELTRHDFSGTGEGWIYSFVVPVEYIGPRGTTLTLLSDTWNPKEAGHGDRDETLGLYLHNVEVWQEDRPFTVARERAIPALPATMPARHWWFNDDSASDRASYDAPAPHLIDWWGWYAATAGFPPGTARAWLIAYGATALTIALGGLLLGRSALPRRRRNTRRSARTLHTHS